VKYTKVPQETSVHIPTPQLTKISAVVLEMKLADGRTETPLQYVYSIV
jgi:hypothetical protein